MYNHVAEADRHYAMELGRENPEIAWVLSDRDVCIQIRFTQGRVSHIQSQQNMKSVWRQRQKKMLTTTGSSRCGTTTSR